MALNSILALTTIATLPPARFAAAEPMLRVGQTSAPILSPPNPKFFETAISLDDFKNVDPKHFKWVNPDEIKAGGTTCGFLKAPLGWVVEETDVNYPIVETYVCVTFASQQPASRGNLAVHCGGPGSLSSCGYLIYSSDFNNAKELQDTFNVIGFDQRGMGRSNPTFVVKDCAVALQTLPNFDDEEQIRNVAKIYKEKHLECWNYPDFKLNATQGDGDTRQFHFLEYSGTRQLAEDIERVRLLFGDQKLSIYGISYGTTVMGTYATVFSQNVNLMVLDGSTDPNTDIESQAMDWARSSQQRLDYFIASCDFGDFDCGVPDMRACIDDVNKMVDWIDRNDTSVFGPFPPYDITWTLLGHYEKLADVCEVAKAGDVTSFMNILYKIDSEIESASKSPTPPPQELEAEASDPLLNSESGPTVGSPSADYGDVYQRPGYIDLVNNSTVCQDMIWAQDNAFGAYDEDRYVHFLQKINEEYPGEGTQLPTQAVLQWYSATYFWPNITPLPPLGNPNLSGIIAGQLYDPATPYIFTQNMREKFNSATLLTSRSVNHGLSDAVESMAGDLSCFANILRYFKNGEIDFTDGKVCESKHALTGCTIGSILQGKRCGPSPPSLLPLTVKLGLGSYEFYE